MPTGPSNATQTLIAEFRATRVSFTMWGVKRALEDANLAEVAATFGADAKLLGASKKLIDTKAAAYRKVTGIKSRIARAWHDATVPYPEPGLRLIKEEDLNKFAATIACDRQELLAAVETLQGEYSQLRERARTQLGQLYNASDYPMTLIGLFDVSWEFPSVSPPEYLKQLNPALYEQERQRMIARFESAVRLTEQAFISEFEGLVSHIAERLTGTTEDGKPKVFKDSTITNLTGFFEKFRHLNVGSSSQLDALVEQAQSLVKGVNPAQLKPESGETTAAQDALRKLIADNMAAVSTQLQGLMIEKPRRRLVREKADAAA